jgi:hypothetical protein
MTRIAQIYGYAVCLVAVIVFVANIGDFTSNVIALGDPLHAEPRFSGRDNSSLSSYETYRIDQEETVERQSRNQASGEHITLPSDSALRARYSALRSASEGDARAAIRRELAQSAVLLAVSCWLARWASC